jgi:hypothetical protein
MLSLAVFILCQPLGQTNFNVTGNSCIFLENAESRYSENLTALVDSFTTTEVMILGGLKSDIGTHSIRKGAVSYCLGVEGPNVTMVYQRAGWSLGNVQDRYIFAGLHSVHYLL